MPNSLALAACLLLALSGCGQPGPTETPRKPLPFARSEKTQAKLVAPEARKAKPSQSVAEIEQVNPMQ